MTKLARSEAVKRSKTKRGRRILLSKEPQLIEPTKRTLLLKGHTTSHFISQLLSDLYILKKPFSHKLHKKNQLLPFEAGGEVHLESLSTLNDCSLFAVGNHTKKRPHNLVLGRLFGGRMLDMVEFGVRNYRRLAEGGSSRGVSVNAETRPLLLFNGVDEEFDAGEEMSKMQNFLVDWFRGPKIEKLNLAGVDRAIVFTLKSKGCILFRQYGVVLKKGGGGGLPKLELKEIGLSMDLYVRRTHFASDDLMKAAMKQPKLPPAQTKKKNISKTVMGDTLGRVHTGRQDLSELALARMKGLGKKRGQQNLDIEVEDDEGASGSEEKGESPAKRMRSD